MSNIDALPTKATSSNAVTATDISSNKRGLDIVSYASENLLRVDIVSSNLIYIGSGIIGFSESDPKWKIQKVVISGSNISINFADSDSQFNKIWANRITYTY